VYPSSKCIPSGYIHTPTPSHTALHISCPYTRELAEHSQLLSSPFFSHSRYYINNIVLSFVLVTDQIVHHYYNHNSIDHLQFHLSRTMTPPFSPVPSSLPDLVVDHHDENDQTISDFNDLFDFDGFASDVCFTLIAL